MDKLAICINFEEDALAALDQIGKYIDLKGKKVEFLHVWNNEYYPYPGSMVVAFYPNKEQCVEIQQKMEEELAKIASDFAQKNNCEAVSKVFQSLSEKKAICEYVDENKIDLSVCLVPKRDKISEFFHSSFCHYLQVHSQSNVLCVKA